MGCNNNTVVPPEVGVSIANFVRIDNLSDVRTIPDEAEDTRCT
jgi:hypothetical protein